MERLQFLDVQLQAVYEKQLRDYQAPLCWAQEILDAEQTVLCRPWCWLYRTGI